MAQYKILTAGDIRTKGEKLRLWAGLLTLAFVALLGGAEVCGLIVMSLVVAFFVVKFQQGVLLGNSVRVNGNNFPWLEQLANDAARSLGITTPDIYITQSPELNAYASAIFGQQLVVLHSSLVESLAPNELKFIIGHEMTHIKCGHTLLQALMGPIEELRVPVLSRLFSVFLLSWSRKAEETADHGGFIACGDLLASSRAITSLLAGTRLAKDVSLDELNVQYIRLRSTIFGRLSELTLSHPFLIQRLRNLQAYSQNPFFMQSRQAA